MIFLSLLVTLVCLIGSVTGLVSNPSGTEKAVLIGWLIFGLLLFILTVLWYRGRKKKGKKDNLSDCYDCDPSAFYIFNFKRIDCDKDGDCDCSPDCSS
ncbi:MAG TPA: hypothetical protein VEY51_08595 [Chondromyces sp.]|nr:hypothetical protein [Chondromyces sp.]